MITYKFDVDCVSDAGNVKQINEDSFTVLRHDALTSSRVLVAVADGVGGLGHGEVASSMAVQSLEQWWKKLDWAAMPKLDDMMVSLVKRVEDVHGDIISANKEKQIQSGTTLSVLLLAEEDYRVFHAGDSRVYRIESGMFGGVEQLTTDHVKMMPKVVNGGAVMKPYLTQCLGYQGKFKYQELTGSCRPGEMFVVCSDGVYKTLHEKNLEKIVRRRKNKVDKACCDLITQAKDNGEKDNLTAAVVRIIH